MDPVGSLLSRREKWLAIVGLLFAGGLAVFASFYNSNTPDVATIRAIRHAAGPEAGPIRVAGRYRFEEADGLSSSDIQLACGTVILLDESRSFAVLVRTAGPRRAKRYVAEELALEPSEEEAPTTREAQLLGACEG
ncbi:hypothetical protein [Brevundimonas sp. LjRoot202]|uniref:hypothetical protein n=1 Tax=Brevundimonas sp. LjRoot202 TaxID=3342281 RepID=UPI003ED028EE